MDVFQKQVDKAVKKLGKTPQQMAKSLQTRKIKGHAGDPNSCPLANYLMREFGVDTADVSDEGVSANGVEIPATSVVNKFIVLFDAGKFPKLEE